MKKQYGKMFESTARNVPRDTSPSSFSGLKKVKQTDSSTSEKRVDADADIRGWCAAINLTAPIASVLASNSNNYISDIVEIARRVENGLASRLVGAGAQMPRHTYMRRTVAAMVVDRVRMEAEKGRDVLDADQISEHVLGTFDKIAAEPWFVSSFGEDVNGGFDETVAITCSSMNAAHQIHEALGANADDGSVSACLKITQETAEMLMYLSEVTSGSSEGRQMLVQNSIKHAAKIVSDIALGMGNDLDLSVVAAQACSRAESVSRSALDLTSIGASLLSSRRVIAQSDAQKSGDISQKNNDVTASPSRKSFAESAGNSVDFAGIV